MRRLACVILVDPDGRLLLQERDEDAPVDPDRWGLVGGGVEPGEDDETAAYRGLEEETGVVLPRRHAHGMAADPGRRRPARVRW